MLEEMALTVGELCRIGGFLLSPGGADELCELYVGRVSAPNADAAGIAGHGGMAAENEDIRVRVWPADRAIAAALDGRMANPIATIGLLWLAARREALRKEWLAA
jgi:ADP-ribose pyrophosphatase